jgi:hypothetical protein
LIFLGQQIDGRQTVKKQQLVLFAAVGCLFALVVFLFWQLVFMRFWLYHSQNRKLNPADYEVRLLTAEEYEQLVDPNVRQVRVANGSQTMIKAADRDWQAKAKSRYKPVYNGKYYVEVTTKGTAHVLDHWYGTFVPAAIFSLGALLFLGVYHRREKGKE